MGLKPQEIRFGVMAVRHGFVTPEQVVDALEIQVVEDLSKGWHRPIGEILLEQELISRSQFDKVLNALERPKMMALDS